MFCEVAAEYPTGAEFSTRVDRKYNREPPKYVRITPTHVVEYEWREDRDSHTLHDCPTIINENYLMWKRRNVLHRPNDLPAVIYTDKVHVEYYCEGKLHRDVDAPARISNVCRGTNGKLMAELAYYKNNMLHREDGPALIKFVPEIVLHRDSYRTTYNAHLYYYTNDVQVEKRVVAEYPINLDEYIPIKLRDLLAEVQVPDVVHVRHMSNMRSVIDSLRVPLADSLRITHAVRAPTATNAPWPHYLNSTNFTFDDLCMELSHESRSFYSNYKIDLPCNDSRYIIDDCECRYNGELCDRCEYTLRECKGCLHYCQSRNVGNGTTAAQSHAPHAPHTPYVDVCEHHISSINTLYSELVARPQSIKLSQEKVVEYHYDIGASIRYDLPAIVTNNKYIFVDYDGKIHRDGDKPAVIYANEARCEWRQRGMLHRDGNRPAIVKNVMSDGRADQLLFVRDLLHREDGPAVVKFVHDNHDANGIYCAKCKVEFWLNGIHQDTVVMAALPSFYLQKNYIDYGDAGIGSAGVDTA